MLRRKVMHNLEVRQLAGNSFDRATVEDSVTSAYELHE